MTESMRTLDVRKSLGHVLNRVACGGDSFVVERKGRPVAAIVPLARLEKLERIEAEAGGWLCGRQDASGPGAARGPGGRSALHGLLIRLT